MNSKKKLKYCKTKYVPSFIQSQIKYYMDI